MHIYTKFLFFLFLFGISLNATAQFNFNTSSGSDNKQDKQKEKQDSTSKKQVYLSRIQSCKVDEFLGEKKAINYDTATLNFQNQTFPERNNTIASENLGNIGSPFISKVFMDRTQKTPFLFMNSYDNWITSPNEQVYLNTTTPYTNLKYLTTSGNDVSQEEDFKFLFSVNANKYLNLGIDYEVLFARGSYTKNSARSHLANFNGNYQSPRYEAFWKLSNNYLENYENGGITDDRYITDPMLMSGGYSAFESMNIPVALSDAKSQIKNLQLFFNQKYNIGFEQVLIKDTSAIKDSTNIKTLKTKNNKNNLAARDTIVEFVPVTSIIHTLYIDKSQKSYRATSADLAYYDSITNISNSYTADTASLLLIRNTFGISLREGFHKWAKFGLTGFLEHDFRQYMELSPTASQRDTSNAFSRYTFHNQSLIWAGGELSKRKGSVLTYDALAKICIFGENLGDFELKGNLNTTFSLWNHPVSLSANGYITNLHPDFFMEHYYSNSFNWDNTFKNEYKTQIQGTLSIPDIGFDAQVGVNNMTNLLYFNNTAVPDQYSGNIQVLSLKWKQHLRSGILNFDNEAVYQLSSNQNVLPLPDISVYSNIYLKFLISKVMTSYVGVDCRYNTSYYAPAYMPATEQFYTQKDVKIGNYPFMNLYGNFQLKRMRFFVMYSHLSSLFASPEYFSAPHYPMNPAILKVGLSWNFYD